MAGLNCGTVSLLAWPAIRDGLSAAVGVTEDDAEAARLALADHGLAVGPCGAAALAGVDAALAQRGGAQALGLCPESHVVLLSTEGAAAQAGDAMRGK